MVRWRALRTFYGADKVLRRTGKVFEAPEGYEPGEQNAELVEAPKAPRRRRRKPQPEAEQMDLTEPDGDPAEEDE